MRSFDVDPDSTPGRNNNLPACEGVYPTDPDISTQLTSQDIGSTAEMNSQSVELAAIPDNSIELYKKGKTTITVTIDPIIKKDIRFKWTYELSGLETPAVYEDALVGSTDGFDDRVSPDENYLSSIDSGEMDPSKTDCDFGFNDVGFNSVLEA